MKHIDLVYFNYGGGHRAAALALQGVIRTTRPDWRVRLVDLVEVLDPKGAFRKLTGLAPEDLYNKRLARGWTLGLTQELKLVQGLIRLGHTTLVRRLAQHWLASEPDLVVSLVPNFNRALCESVAGSLPGVPTWPTIRPTSGSNPARTSTWCAARRMPWHRRGRRGMRSGRSR